MFTSGGALKQQIRDAPSMCSGKTKGAAGHSIGNKEPVASENRHSHKESNKSGDDKALIRTSRLFAADFDSLPVVIAGILQCVHTYASSLNPLPPLIVLPLGYMTNARGGIAIKVRDRTYTAPLSSLQMTGFTFEACGR